MDLSLREGILISLGLKPSNHYPTISNLRKRYTSLTMKLVEVRSLSKSDVDTPQHQVILFDID